jgi:putative ABC transport system permease protein
MNLKDVFWLSFKDLNEKRVRTALTIIMVVIGVAAIVALTSVTAGISQSITSQLNTLGPTSIIVTTSGTTGFTVADVAKIESLPNISSVTPVLSGSASLYSGNQNISVSLIGVTTQGLSQILGGNVTLYQGTLYQDDITPSAVIGHSVAFPTSAAGTQKVSIGQAATLKTSGRNGETVTIPVLGILPSHGGFIIPVDSAVFVSLPAAELLLHKSSFNEMLVLASNTSNVNSTSNLITSLYGSSARVTTTASLLSTAASITGALGLLFGAIAGVSLVVAAIGIMNVMLIAVYERTHEIGIMKSVGFKNRDVMMIFLFQALIIGMIGGVIGLGLGAGGAYGLSAVFSGGSARASTTSTGSTTATTRGSGGGFSSSGGSGAGGGFGGGGSSSSASISFKPVFPVTTIVYAILVAVLVSIFAGLYPAWRASKMEPIDALREL